MKIRGRRWKTGHVVDVLLLASLATGAVYVTLSAVGGSGQSGRAVLRQIGAEVVLTGTIANESRIQPAESSLAD